MCKTYNTIGSLSSLKLHLEDNHIYDFKSLMEVIDFQKSFTFIRQQLIAQNKKLIEEEKERLNEELKSLESTIANQRLKTEQILTDEIDKLKGLLNISLSESPTNLFQKISNELKNRNYRRKIKHLEDSFNHDVETSLIYLLVTYREKNKRYHFINSNYYEALNQSVDHALSELDRKKAVVDSLNSFIYGAIGEQKVVKALENLSDDYFLINDFSVSFSPALYNKQENDYIMSVQIDHILVAPSGIFLIETKNWSEKSLENLSLRSPVKQIKRTSYALFKLLNNEWSKDYLHLDKHHWGDKKIPIKNLIVLTNTKPREEFQHVKIVTLNELLGYIRYFTPIFSSKDTMSMADYILSINEQKKI